MRRVPATSIAAAVILFTCAARAGSAGEFVVSPGGASRVVFASKAPVESFEGKTSKLQGSIAVDPANVGDSVTVRLEVDLASLDTGIAKRNEHMRENHLETAKYPTAVFAGAAVASPRGARLDSGKPVTFDCEGTFTLHGVTRRLHTSAVVTLEDGGNGGHAQLRFRATFAVSLADYAIARPQFLFLKLADEQQLTVSGVAIARE
jgi:polyisoprenoid-binding protein YceI